MEELSNNGSNITMTTVTPPAPLHAGDNDSHPGTHSLTRVDAITSTWILYTVGTRRDIQAVAPLNSIGGEIILDCYIITKMK